MLTQKRAHYMALWSQYVYHTYVTAIATLPHTIYYNILKRIFGILVTQHLLHIVDRSISTLTSFISDILSG